MLLSRKYKILLGMIQRGSIQISKPESPTPVILNGRGRQLKIHRLKKSNNRQDRYSICLRLSSGKVKVRLRIGFARLVWMISTNSIIPRNYEIHHIDGDWKNNRFSNLLSVHSLDHQKFHQDMSDVPF